MGAPQQFRVCAESHSVGVGVGSNRKPPAGAPDAAQGFDRVTFLQLVGLSVEKGEVVAEDTGVAPHSPAGTPDAAQDSDRVSF